jgi:hypothetical protein
MWDIRGIGQPWDIAIETGMLSLTSTKVRPGPAGTVFESDDPVAQVHLGRSIVNLLLLQAVSLSPAVETAGPQISTIMLQLFALLCRPEGHDLGYLREMNGRLAGVMRDGDAAERSAVLVCSAILREMRCWISSAWSSTLTGSPRCLPVCDPPWSRRSTGRERGWPSIATSMPFRSSPTSDPRLVGCRRRYGSHDVGPSRAFLAGSAATQAPPV